VTAAEEQLKALYQKGVTDGMETALSLLLGRKTDGVEGFQGPLSPEAQNWAMSALAAIHQARGE
jgi:hypothetical protein